MELKKTAIPLIVPVLFIAFALSCLLVWLYGGKSKRWINNKLKIGGLILTLTTVTTGCPIVTCYDPPQTDQFVFDKQKTGYDLTLQLPTDTLITGKIYNRLRNKYHFEVVTSDTSLVQKGNIEAIDGTFDQDPEPFSLNISNQLDSGLYELKLFSIETINGTEHEFEVDFRRLKIER